MNESGVWCGFVRGFVLYVLEFDVILFSLMHSVVIEYLGIFALGNE